MDAFTNTKVDLTCRAEGAFRRGDLVSLRGRVFRRGVCLGVDGKTVYVKFGRDRRVYRIATVTEGYYDTLAVPPTLALWEDVYRDPHTTQCATVIQKTGKLLRVRMQDGTTRCIESRRAKILDPVEPLRFFGEPSVTECARAVKVFFPQAGIHSSYGRHRIVRHEGLEGSHALSSWCTTQKRAWRAAWESIKFRMGEDALNAARTRGDA